MRTTLQKRNSPLLGIESYPTVEANKSRYLALGYERSSGLDIFSISEKLWSLPSQHPAASTITEQERVDLLEEFDEFEEWTIKCTHYGIMMASNGKVPQFDIMHQMLTSETGPFQSLPSIQGTKKKNFGSKIKKKNF